MIYIHCQNLGLREQHIGNLGDATAENFSWLFKLSPELTSNNERTTVIEMPDSLADALIEDWLREKCDDALWAHLGVMLKYHRSKWAERLDYSVNTLNRDERKYALYCGAYMAKEIEQTHLDDHEKEIFALLDAQGFVKVEE